MPSETYACAMSGSTKSANGVPGFCALSAIDLLRRSPLAGGSGFGVCRRSAGGSFGGAGVSAGFATNGSPALISSRNSSRISPSAVKIRLSVTLISDFGLSVIVVSSLGSSGDRKRYSKCALPATAATIRALADAYLSDPRVQPVQHRFGAPDVSGRRGIARTRTRRDDRQPARSGAGVEGRRSGCEVRRAFDESSVRLRQRLEARQALSRGETGCRARAQRRRAFARTRRDVPATG